MDFAKLLARVKNLVLTPAAEWPVIAGEAASQPALLIGHAVPLAGLVGIVLFVKLWVIGIANILRVPLFSSLLAAILLVAVLVGVAALSGIVVNALAANFGTTPDAAQGIKTGAYAMTPVFLTGILAAFSIDNWELSIFLWIAGFGWGAWQMTVGLPHTLKTPQEKRWPYAGAVMGICLLALIVGISIARSIVLRNVFGANFGGM